MAAMCSGLYFMFLAPPSPTFLDPLLVVQGSHKLLDTCWFSFAKAYLLCCYGFVYIYGHNARKYKEKSLPKMMPLVLNRTQELKLVIDSHKSRTQSVYNRKTECCHENSAFNSSLTSMSVTSRGLGWILRSIRTSRKWKEGGGGVGGIYFLLITHALNIPMTFKKCQLHSDQSCRPDMLH